MKQKRRQNIIGMVYDFDGTLSPHNLQEDTIFQAYRIDKRKFWEKTHELVVKRGYERTLSYLMLLIHDPIFQKKPLTRERLRDMASRLVFYPGVLDFFDRMNRFVRSLPEVKRFHIRLEHYLVSSGLKEILEASTIARYFKKIYASEYDYDLIRPIFPKLVINDTNKTQFLFRINKGRLDLSQDINSHMPEEERRIPFSNMIYVGDGTTDIPSMTLTQKSGGHAIAVFPPGSRVPREVADMIREGRADHFAPADFREGKLLSKILELTLRKIVQNITYEASSRMSLDWLETYRNDTRRVKRRKAYR